jgi:hypothetical protein
MADRNLWILRTSCLLSILGSIIVMIACIFPKKMWKKKGRQLIFWLSVSDLATSLVYFLSSFEHGDKNSKLCQTTSLLGIFFPIASFIWTDFIALYLYTMIHSRKLTTENEWMILMRWFHLLSWGIAGLSITLVGAFHHAGRTESNDENAEQNTGGWCWVVTSKYSNLILWEVIGGKMIEWLSCFIILPYLYSSTAKTLVQLDLSSLSTQQMSHSHGKREGGGGGMRTVTVASASTSSLLPSSAITRSSLTSSSTQSISDSRTASQLSTGGANFAQQETETLRNPKFQRFYIKMVCHLLFSSSPHSNLMSSLSGHCPRSLFLLPNLGYSPYLSLSPLPVLIFLCCCSCRPPCC